MKTIFYVLLLSIVNISCHNVYFKDRNPANLPVATLPPDMLGEYLGEGNNEITITADKIDLQYYHGGSPYWYEGGYGANSEMPVFKIGNSYMVSYNNPEKNDYYRIFLFNYDSSKGQIYVKEIFGNQKDDEKKENLSKIYSAKMLTDPDLAAEGTTDVDFLVDPSPAEFTSWVNNGAFEEVAVFQKINFECNHIEYSLECNEYESWKNCIPSDYEEDIEQKIMEYIEYYKKKKKQGFYEFSINLNNSYKKLWFRINIRCAE